MRKRIEKKHGFAAAGLAALLIVGLGAGYLKAPRETLMLPPRVPDATGPVPVQGVVQARTASSITVVTANGPVTLKLGPATPVESMRSIGLDSFQAGDQVNVGGIPHNQTLYAITGIVDIPATLVRSAP